MRHFSRASQLRALTFVAMAAVLPACGGGSDGDPGAAGAPGAPGFLRLVSDQTVGVGGTNTVSFTGLNGDVDRAYVLHAQIPTMQYGPGSAYATFTTTAADPSPLLAGSILEFSAGPGIGSGFNTLNPAGINVIGRSTGSTSGVSGSFEMKVMAQSGTGRRGIFINASTDLMGETLTSGNLSGTGNLTAIHLTAAVSWSAGTRFQLYAYGP